MKNNEYKSILLDGSLGTQLIQKLGSKLSNTFKANLDFPDAVQEIHQSYVNSGSQILFTNTFGCLTREAQTLTQTTFKKCLRSAIQLARKASNKNTLVGLCLGPLGLALDQPLKNKKTLSHKLEMIFDLAIAQDVDFIVFETQYHYEEMAYTLALARKLCPIPLWLSLTVIKEGRPLFEKTHPDWLKYFEGLGIDVLGFNCGFGPESIVKAINRYSSQTELPLFAKPSKGLPDALGKYTMSDADFCKALTPLKKKNLYALGACCGSSPQTIEKIKKYFATT